jgi:sugar fermentation stimulation protein A
MLFPFTRPILEGTLVKRYKRFLADVEVGGEVLTVHCPNSGSMLGCNFPGSPVLISDSKNPARKLRHTLEAIKVGRTWVGVNTSIPNSLVGKLLAAGHIEPLAEYQTIRAEYAISKQTRLDFYLQQAGLPDAYVEVKNVSLAEGAVAKFPDSVTERGAKHMNELEILVRQGNRAAVVFFVNRSDCKSFAPALQIDPAYAASLAKAVTAGVEIYPLSLQVSPKGHTFKGILPVELPATA